jgi:cation:H+ antiporter
VITAVLSGFELENLAAGIAANTKGLPGAAAGTFLGGTAFLALGVASLTGLIAPIRARLIAAVLLWTAAPPLPLLALSLDGRLSRPGGVVLIIWFAISLTGLARSGGHLIEAQDEAPPPRLVGVRLAGGLALLIAGGDLLASSLRNVVRHLSISQTLLGNTAIATAVEAEEVARVAVPSRRGRGDVALANLAGTIVHFTALHAGLVVLVKPLPLDSATRHLHLPAAVASTFVLCAVLALRGGIGRLEGSLLLALYAACVAAAITS